mmetsp:Transcript_29589/g.83395  ORF Transcript_29589/g.83395 Transcript_29589/m.83395 type:complete len:204 (+) Transcript_29589:1498-2109(+)
MHRGGGRLHEDPHDDPRAHAARLGHLRAGPPHERPRDAPGARRHGSLIVDRLEHLRHHGGPPRPVDHLPGPQGRLLPRGQRRPPHQHFPPHRDARVHGRQHPAEQVGAEQVPRRDDDRALDRLHGVQHLREPVTASARGPWRRALVPWWPPRGSIPPRACGAASGRGRASLASELGTGVRARRARAAGGETECQGAAKGATRQ